MKHINRDTLLQIHDETTSIARDILVSKNMDYGADEDALKNFRLCEALGIPMKTGIMTRTIDKMARISNVLRSGETSVKSETVEDTIIDAINYLIILRASIVEDRMNGVCDVVDKNVPALNPPPYNIDADLSKAMPF